MRCRVRPRSQARLLDDFTSGERACRILQNCLNWPAPKPLGFSFACVIIKWANAQGLVSLHEISPNAAAINDVTAILSGAFTVVWFVETIIRWGVRIVSASRRRRQVRQLLQTLSEPERQSLRSMLHLKQQSFYTTSQDPTAQMLVHKGLLDASRLGDSRYWTFIIPTVVWEEIRLRWPEDAA
jgi:hypothetical protein